MYLASKGFAGGSIIPLGCDSNCVYTWIEGCDHTCTGCKGSCSGYCEDDCQGTCVNTCAMTCSWVATY